MKQLVLFRKYNSIISLGLVYDLYSDCFIVKNNRYSDYLC